MIQQPPQLRFDEVDIGSDHFFHFFIWKPDFDIPSNAEKWAHLAHLIKTQPVVGASVRHKCKTETGWHEGGIHFKTELTDAVEGFRDGPRWEVKSWEPLHIEPSLQSHCPCKDHGFIRAGKWVRA